MKNTEGSRLANESCSPPVGIALGLGRYQAASLDFIRRRSSNPSDPKTRAKTLPRLFGSISGTAEGLLTGLARRNPVTSSQIDGSVAPPEEDDKEDATL
jgi:hypothetical protein